MPKSSSPFTPSKKFREELKRLVDKFHNHYDTYTKRDYLEEDARSQLINPFFEALEWDIADKAGLGPARREVVMEGGKTEGRPDYNFRINGQTRFFVEAKPPHKTLDAAAIMQAKSYAWNTRDVFIAVLIDFEEIKVYDASLKPNPKYPDVGLLFAYRYDKYLTPDALEHLWLLSREAVRAGSLEHLLKRTAKEKRQRIPVDEAFLADLTKWRDELAKAVYKAHPGMSVADLNSVVQVFLDRLIFIRFAEDRGVLPPRQLQDIVSDWEASGQRRSMVDDLNALFREVNDRLNGEIFKPHQCEKVNWDEERVARIVKALYPPCPYRFDVIGVELLGSIYERYLGNTIRVTEKKAFVEKKPEVRQAKGVYYTPRYIVDYIVAQTVGKLIKGRTPAQIAKLKIIDPACGSGSFLLGAYQCLLDYHLQYYAEHAKSKSRTNQAVLMTEMDPGKARLTLVQKAEILRNNIHGVDLDPQAIEITMMSLYIKILEGERGAILGQGVLPRLSGNIKCGNSLIASDIIPQLGLFSDEDLERIKPFNWESEREGFGAIMKTGGFDVVIGNPPYIQLSMMDYYNAATNEYISRNYTSSMGRLNTFGLFIESVLKVMLRKGGYLSYIVPNTLLTQEYYQEVRQQMLQYDLINITSYEHPVFVDAVVETVVFVLQKSSTQKNKVQIVRCDNKAMTYKGRLISQSIYKGTHANAFLTNVDSHSLALRAKLEKAKPRLKDIANINQAIALKYDRSKSLFQQKKADNFKPVLDGRNIQRYSLEWSGYYLAYDVRNIHSCKRTDIFEANEKIFFRRVGDRLIATYDARQYYALNTLVVITPKNPGQSSLKYLLGLINSRLLNFYYVTYLKSTKKVFSEIQARQLAQIPIRLINLSDPADKAWHDRMVALVERMLELHQRKAEAKSKSLKAQLERESNVTDEQIDGLVYELYGLTEEEVRVVEGK